MKRKINISIIIVMVLLALGACSKKSYMSNASDSRSAYSDDKSSDSGTDKSDTLTDTIFVQISGAVNNPGVYELESDARLFQAVYMAGGLRDDADDSTLNLASKVSDGQKVVVMTKDEVELSRQAYDGKVNINTADESELMTLPGIGESKAKSIIKYREANGPFAVESDIMNISGIKEGVYNKIEDMIKV